MAPRITRRNFLVGTAATAAFAGTPAFAQPKPVKIGLLTVKTGPLAAGGIQMEQGLVCFLKDRNYVLAGRKVELVVADTGGNPAGTKTKTQELVERESVDMILGPLAAFELLAISDYAAQAKMPILSLAAAEDMTQRKPNPFFVRASATSAQGMYPLADYAAKELKFTRVITLADDFAYGHEQMGGFQRVFEDAGGRIAKKLWPPLVTPDYTPYIAQISGADAIVQGFAGSNPLLRARPRRLWPGHGGCGLLVAGLARPGSAATARYARPGPGAGASPESGRGEDDDGHCLPAAPGNRRRARAGRGAHRSGDGAGACALWGDRRNPVRRGADCARPTGGADRPDP